jgi:hypothetical protein
VELISNWTSDQLQVLESLNHKLLPGKRSLLAQGVREAIERLNVAPPGNRHLVMITDGIDSQRNSAALEQALESLIAENITTHIISYTTLGLSSKKPSPARPREGTRVPYEVIVGLPKMSPPGSRKLNPSEILLAKGGGTLDLDRFKKDKNTKEEWRSKEAEFGALAEETGGTLLIPGSAEEMIEKAVNIAGVIDSQYVVSYRPEPPFQEGGAGTYRRLDVISRRVGLLVKSRRGYLSNRVP